MSEITPHPITILVAEDDLDDRLLLTEAFRETRVANTVCFVDDGIELLNYLRRLGKYADPDPFPVPDIVLLDLNMPRRDGREALEDIKADALLRRMPVVILTTSKAEEDIVRSYDIGAAGYITKPVTFAALVEAVRGLAEYWVQIVKLPEKEN